MIVGEFLFYKFPDSDEGVLSKIRASLVNESGFATLAKRINLGSSIYLSSAEENNRGREKPSLLSNAFEAVIGAVYLEAGLMKTREIVINLLNKTYPRIDLDTLCKDYKTALQELTQAQYGITPNYELVGSSGPDHKKEFEIAVKLNSKTLSKAKGKSKKNAQQKAAQIALEMLKKERNE